MNKRQENLKMTVSFPPKLDMLIRREALNERLTLGEMIEKYRDAYLEKLKMEQEQRKRQKEQTEKEKKT